MSTRTPLVLIILDGWGYSLTKTNNAIAAASTPQWNTWWETRPHSLLNASGQYVGLPNAQMGNSEVGHMHIAAGRIIQQDYTRIHDAIQSGDFARNPVFKTTITRLQQTKKALHIIGLLSTGGVHSHEDHLLALLDLCANEQFSSVYLHLFLDGRDTPPRSALESLEKLQAHLAKQHIATICSITGRYYAMDRDKHWERIEPVYRLLTEGVAQHNFHTAQVAVAAYYQQNISDEFIPPTTIGAIHTIQDGDSILFFNFRSDRARQLTEAFLAQSFTGFARNTIPQLANFISMTEYADYLPTTPAFPPLSLNNTLGAVLAKHNLSQLRLAETEKYPHVTFFFNGGVETPFPQETRKLIPSPRVSTYDLQPEMSATAITDALIDTIEKKLYDVIICNYANADMVGHTGNFQATIRAIECIDNALYKINHAISKAHGQLLITADHGNAECLYDNTTQQAHTAHTCNLVPFIYIGDSKWHISKTSGNLIDIAPTILTLLGISPPAEMTGTSLLVHI